jgi:hypothetical protein
MKAFAAAVVLAFPLCASADFVQVEYEGVVNSVTRTVCDCDPTLGYAPDHPEFTAYSVGDRISGSMMIDLAKAPPDRRPLEPQSGIYHALANSGGFISGNGAPRVALVFQDSVSVLDAPEDHPFEHYLVTDQWVTPNGHGQLGVNAITRRIGLDLVAGEGIAQSFDVTPSDDLELVGHLQKFIGSIKGTIGVFAGLNFTRLTVSSPGRCKA